MPTQPKTDRRWVRTRKNIRAAFAKLLIHKDLDTITVKEIVEIADVNRNTFYLHYSNVQEVMEEIENEIIEALTVEVEQLEFSKLSTDPYLFYRCLTHLLYADVDLNTAILRSIKSTSLVQRVKQVLGERLSEVLIASHDVAAIDISLTIDFVTSGMVSVYQSWFLSDKSYSLDDASKRVSRLLSACIASALEETEGERTSLPS